MSKSKSKSKSGSNTTSSSSSSKAQKFNFSSKNLLTILRHQGDFSTDVMQEMAKCLNLAKMGSLMTVIVGAKDTPTLRTRSATKEGHCVDIGKIVLFRAPPVWVDHVEVRQLFVAMTTTPTTLWKNWIDTSKVKELMVGVDDYDHSNRANIVTDEWLSLIGSGKFSQLVSLNLSFCGNITNAGVVHLAHKCPQLTSLDLQGCRNITDAGVIQLADKCSQLTSLNLHGCSNITNASVNNLRQAYPRLNILFRRN